MGFIDTILSYASMAVVGLGAITGIIGLINFGEGKSNNNAGKQDEGMAKVVGGIIIIVIGAVLVPQLSSLLTV